MSEEKLLLNEEDFIYLKWQLNNGVKIFEDKRCEFRIVDYFQYFTVSPKQVLEFYDGYFTEYEKKQLLYLYHEYFSNGTFGMQNQKLLVPENKMKQSYSFILNGEYTPNEYGVPTLVSGTGEIYNTTEEERAEAMEYIIEHGMPQTEKVYVTVLKYVIEKSLPEYLYQNGNLQMKKTIR